MKKFIVLDIEGMSNCRPYNVGYIVGDKKGNIYLDTSIPKKYRPLSLAEACGNRTHPGRY